MLSIDRSQAWGSRISQSIAVHDVLKLPHIHVEGALKEFKLRNIEWEMIDLHGPRSISITERSFVQKSLATTGPMENRVFTSILSSGDVSFTTSATTAPGTASPE